MPRGLVVPAFRYSFGSGAPGTNVPKNFPYFDKSTNPYTPYIYRSGAWKKYGSLPGANATQIQGVNVDNTAPTNGQVLTYSSTEWTPV